MIIMMLPSHLLSQWILENEDIWQLDFQDPSGLYAFTNDRKVIFWDDHIVKLWQLGWIRADIIRSQNEVNLEGIELIGKDNDGVHYFSDSRLLGMVYPDLEVALRTLEDLPPDFKLFFHPFRFFVIYEIQRVVRITIHPFQIFIQSLYPGLLKSEFDHFNRWTNTEELSRLINKWNDVATLAIASEPCFFSYIFGTLKHPPTISYEEQLARIEVHRNRLREEYLRIGIEPIKEIVGDLCGSAEMIEPNKNIHSLLRFMDGQQRLRIRGNLGGAIILKSMAEIIRRMCEWVFEIQLPEEDELGFGIWMKDAKQRMYGSNRIFDANNLISKRQIVRTMGLDAAARIRIYVEGPTEYYALTNLLAYLQQIEFINLSGQIIQAKRKGLAFRDNLVSDDRSGIFSVIFLDQDREDNLRMVRSAAREDIFCGLIYVSKPDFEFENFSIEELMEIVWTFIDETEKNEKNRCLLKEAVREQRNAESFINAARKSIPSLYQLGKGKEWGEKIAQYAIKNPTIMGGDKIRPFLEACQAAVNAINIDYNFNRTNYRVDPETGRLVQR